MRIKNVLTVSLLLLAFVFNCLPVPAQTSDTAQALDRYLTARTELGRFNGSVLVAKDGKVIFRKAYGFSDIEKRIPYTPEMKQEVASITKMFVSMSALMLRDKGKLKLEDGICNYLADCPEAWKAVTIQHLMRHTSGIPDYEEKLELYTPKHVEFMVKPNAYDIIYADAKKLPLDFKPGEKFHYSNTAYVVLGHVIESAAKQPFKKFLEKNILKPAGMKDSEMFVFARPPKNLAPGYTTTETLGWPKILAGVSVTGGHFKKLPPISLQPPATDGGLVSTLDDLYKWSLIMDGTALVSAATAQEVFTPGLDNYGYGWFIDTSFGKKRYSHTGGLPGYLTDFTKIPEEKLTVIVFSNTEGVRLSRVKRDIVAIALGKPWDMPVKGAVVTLTAEQFENLKGNYKMQSGATMRVYQDPEPGALLAGHIPDQFLAGFIPLSPTEFYMPLTEGRVIFTVDEKGRAMKVNVHYSGEDHWGERIP